MLPVRADGTVGLFTASVATTTRLVPLTRLPHPEGYCCPVRGAPDPAVPTTIAWIRDAVADPEGAQ